MALKDRDLHHNDKTHHHDTTENLYDLEFWVPS